MSCSGITQRAFLEPSTSAVVVWCSRLQAITCPIRNPTFMPHYTTATRTSTNYLRQPSNAAGLLA
eukprot:1460217-Amphidinium_carterae.3